MVAVAMLSSIAYVLMLLNFPIPPFPAFLKIDFSDLPALIGALVFGPMAGIMIELLKNVLDYFMTGSETGIPVGHFANFMSGIIFILPTYYVYNKIKSKKGMTVGLIIGTILMALVMSVLELFCFTTSLYVFLEYASYEWS